MNLRQLEIFHAIMKSGSITVAAQLMNVSQPAISHALRHYEDKLGMKLFERQAGRLVPTLEARQIFPDVQQIFRRVETLERRLQDLKGGHMGSVSVAATPVVIGGGELPVAIARYIKQNPNNTVEVESQRTPEVIELVVRREVDFGLTHIPSFDPSLDVEPLSTMEIACVMRNEDPLAQRAVVSIHDLDHVPIISYSHSAVQSAPIRRAFAAVNAFPQIMVQTNDAFSAFLMVEAGLGVAVVHASYNLARRFPELTIRSLDPPIPVALSLVRPVGQTLSRNALDLIAEMRSVLEADPGAS